jgi:hypothetical protein
MGWGSGLDHVTNVDHVTINYRLVIYCSLYFKRFLIKAHILMQFAKTHFLMKFSKRETPLFQICTILIALKLARAHFLQITVKSLSVTKRYKLLDLFLISSCY